MQGIIKCHQTALHLTAASGGGIPRVQLEHLLQRRAGFSLFPSSCNFQWSLRDFSSACLRQKSLCPFGFQFPGITGTELNWKMDLVLSSHHSDGFGNHPACLGSSFFAFLQSGWKPAFLRGKSGLKLMCVFCLEELSPKWFNMMKLVAFTAFLLYCNRVALQIILKNYVLHELAWLLSPISFKFHLKHLIFSKWHWLLAEHFPSTTFVMALL